ncbi:MAG: PIG-L family deacetylase [Acidobacteria bacterium]|nr:MAG: PIG-L family deacetylase [Acidobacteriota bacterium]
MRSTGVASERRTFLRHALGIPGLLATGAVGAPEIVAAQIKPGSLKVVCVGAHPDDPESGCGGTLATYAALGHRVTIVYLTRGERGIPGKSDADAAAIRTAEAETACGIIGAKPVFAGQIDGSTEVTRERVNQVATILNTEAPDVVFTHWPIDTHMDHEVASLLTFRAYVATNRRFPIYFFEVDAGAQTLGFAPAHYVDITRLREKKKSALFAHKSQNGERIYSEHHEVMENWRGREARVAAAEAFVLLPSARGADQLPGT